MQKWALQIPSLIEENYGTTIGNKGLFTSAVNQANKKVKRQIKEAIDCLSWREFESKFLGRILTALGFESFQITQQTRDRGQDAINCQYRDGITRREAIVSAKHWKDRNVSIEEIQRVRGIRGNADTGIIITSSNFTKPAKIEAEHTQSFRRIVLIDGDQIVESCFEKGIGVKPVVLPQLYEFDRLSILPGSGG